MQISRIKNLLVILVSFLMAQVSVAASVVESEFEMSVPRTFQQDLIEKVWDGLQKEVFHMDWTFADQTYESGEMKVLLTGLKLDLSSRLQKPAVDSGGDSVVLQSREMEAAFHIGAVSIDQWVERDIGGIIGRFRIQARCENVHLRMQPGKAVFALKLSPVFASGKVSARVDDMELAWAADGWSVNEMSCTGAAGFEDVIRDEILKLTGDSSFMNNYKTAMMAYIQNLVSERSFDFSQPRVLAGLRPDIHASFQVTDFVGQEDGLFLRGRVRVVFDKGSSRDRVFLKLTGQGLSAGSQAGPLIRVPEDFVTALATRGFEPGSWLKRMSSKDIPGFSSLMQSRFSQFFVWRELMRYPKSSRFIFDVVSSQKLSITGKDLRYKIKTSLSAQMYAPRGGNHVPFMDFGIPLTSDVGFSIQDGKVTAKFSKADLDLKATWEPSYVEKYRPYRTFSKDTIVKKIKAGIEGGQMSWLLPEIPLSENLLLKIVKAVPAKDSADLIIYLREASETPR